MYFRIIKKNIMRKLIKFVIVVTLLLIFCFSTNPMVSSVREKTVSVGKSLYTSGVNALASSKNENIAKFVKNNK